MENLNGLSNISSVASTLRIRDNGLITNLNGLQNISAVGEQIEISYNDSLLDLNGLKKLASLQTLFIRENSFTI